MIVRVRFFHATQPREFKNVSILQQKGDLISIWVEEERTAYKFPIQNIWCIEEDYSDEVEPTESYGLIDPLVGGKYNDDGIISMRLLPEDPEDLSESIKE